MLSDEEYQKKYNSLSEHYKKAVDNSGITDKQKLNDFIYTCWDCDYREKENVKNSSGYIMVTLVDMYRKKLIPWQLPVAEEIPKQGVYLLANDRCSLTRDIKEAFYIEGNALKQMDICFISGGCKYEFVNEQNAARIVAQNPPPRKSISKKIREEVYKKYNGHCAYCGCEIDIKEMQVDHMNSHMDNMGEDDINNYVPSCSVCNRVKWAFTIERFRKRIHRCGEIHRARKKPLMADSDKIAIKYGLQKEDHEIEFYFEKGCVKHNGNEQRTKER